MTSPVRAGRSTPLRAAAFLAFFLSGASSLVFQTLWSRSLSHVFGSSSIAVSSVVSVFMAGLGLGAYWFGKRADRLREPLRLYALVETGVGCIALIVPMLLRSDGWLASVNAALRAHFGSGSALFLLARFLCIFPILIVPTTLMGSTLPLLSRHFVDGHSDAVSASRAVARLYAVNTFGAVIGVFTCSFVLLPRLGVSATNVVAACTNFSLALLITLLRRWERRQPAAEEVLLQPLAAGDEASPTTDAPLPLLLRRAAALAFAGSGFSSLVYEVVWSRALINTIGGSLYSFSLILTTFLVGIAAGSAVLGGLLAERVEPLALASVGGVIACLLPAAAWAVHAGSLWSALATSAAVFGVLIGARVARARKAQLVLFEIEPTNMFDRAPAFWILGIPVLVALAALVHRADRLSAITLAVVVMGCLFLGVLLALYRQPFGTLIALQLFIAISTLTSEAFADQLSLTFASMVAPLYEVLPDRVGTVQSCMFLTAALCVLPSALGMGAVFAATLRVWTAGGDRIGRDVGLVYAGNTCGSIAGAWLPGFVLMPALGMQATLHLGMLWNLATALALAWIAARSAMFGRRARRLLTLTAAGVPWLMAFILFATLRPNQLLGWNISKMTLGAFRISLARDVLDEETWGAPDLVYYRDGLSTTVTVERWGRHYSLKNNGKVDASNGDDMPTQIMVAALPLLLHERDPSQLNVAIVGFGSGVTVGAAVRFPIRSLQVVELERSTVEASRFFADVNHLDYAFDKFPYVREPRLTVIDDDGRNYLAAARSRYDVIVSEPSNPWLTGVSDLFTRDHFQIAKRKLAPGGLYCQWAQLYELSPENVKILYRTFAENFRYVVVFSAEDLSSDTVLIGSDSPLPLDLRRVTRSFEKPGIATELERAYIHTPEDVLARVLLASRAEVLRFTAGAPINTDDNARIELAAPRDLIGFERYKGYLETMYAPSWPYGRLADSLVGMGEGRAGSASYAQLALSLLAHGRKAELSQLLARARALSDSPQLQLSEEIYALMSGAAPEPALNAEDAAVPASAEPRIRTLLEETLQRVRSAIDARHYADGLAQLERVPTRLRRDAGGAWSLLEGYLSYKAGDADGAIEVFEALLRSQPDYATSHGELYYYLARAHDAEQHFDKAVRNMRAFVAARAYAQRAEADPTAH
jgi:predicted membrane-bound spermidine synthase/tetratricopeptide (TPR) repeat protein